ncbi:MAG: helix-turn-helix transcriptional regulator [Bacteroidales bacterium]|nr:helix-turn-helix transcriptional regulator [Bacteroidales bacterium]
MDSRKIYNRIAILRHERRLSRKELADRVGVNYQTIGYLEREEYNPSLDLAFRLSEVFDLPVTLIFSTKPLEPLSQELLNQNSKTGGHHARKKN